MWTIEFSAEAEHDFELIFEHLLQTYQDFGDDLDIALDRAEQRLLTIQSSSRDLAKTPFQGTLRSDILEGLRFVRHNKAIFWFVVNEDHQVIRILAVFFGGQDHLRHMLTRLLSGPIE